MSDAIDAYRAAVPDHLESWDLADPARLLHDLARHSPLTTGSTLLCRVQRPATDQRLLGHTEVRLDTGAGGRPRDELDARDEVEAAMRRIGHRDFEWDDDVRLTSAVVVVVIRTGRAVTRSTDYVVSSVLRYANNPFQALRGDLLVVTPYGWICQPSGVAGLSPVATEPDRGAGSVASMQAWRRSRGGPRTSSSGGSGRPRGGRTPA